MQRCESQEVSGPSPSGRGAGDLPQALPLSADDRSSLRQAAALLAERLERESLVDLCRLAADHDGGRPERCVFLGRDGEEMRAALHAFALGLPHERAVCGRAGQAAPEASVFVYAGHGGQRPGMGAALVAREPVFRRAAMECDRLIRREAGWSVLDVLVRGAAVEGIERVQPLLFTFQVALTALWRSWGIEPAATIGHSMGEVAAAHAAGALSLSDAVAITCRRSVLLSRLRGTGAMLLLGLAPDEIGTLAAASSDRVSIAAINGPRTTVLSGAPEELEAIRREAERRGVFSRSIDVEVASHSPQMEPLTEELIAVLATVRPRRPRVPFYSTVLGGPVSDTVLDGRYWARNLREPVRFYPVLQRLAAAGHRRFVELSPHPLLVTSVLEGLRTQQVEDPTVVWSVRRDGDELLAMRLSLARLHVAGAPVRWPCVNGGQRGMEAREANEQEGPSSWRGAR